ncbi:hypothetical protein yinte0001_16330 [Yersinia intermedia ATCC 29909]|nr:hypothetical protein yinte0001_16330 [Yersinia intermedia ATCC 29909]
MIPVLSILNCSGDYLFILPTDFYNNLGNHTLWKTTFIPHWCALLDYSVWRG